MIHPKIRLNDGHAIPQLGLGVWQIPAGRKCEAAVLSALEAGYRHVDTASFYGNEESVGAAIRASGIPREEIFVTTKLSNSEHSDPERAFEASLRKLKMDYLDLYLIHYPVRERHQSWRVFDKLQQQERTRSIGVSNFTIRHLTELLAETEIAPAVNQVEFHPYLFQCELLDFCSARGIRLEAYCPLTRGQRLNDPKLIAMVKKYATASPPRAEGRRTFFARDTGSKSTAQILIRWAIQRELVVIPKSVHPSRIRENAEIFDFEITADDMRTLDRFNENLRTSWDPTNAP